MRGNQLQVSATKWQQGRLPDLIRKFYLVKNHKIAKNSTTTKARQKSTDLESLEF
jgi:hypothetical protein